MMTAFLDSIGYGQWILHALIVIPLAGMIAIALGSAAAAKRTALVVTTIEFILSIGLWWAVDTAPGTLQLVSSTPWIPGWGIHYRLGIDGISLFMVLLTTMLLPLCVLSSWTYIAKQEHLDRIGNLWPLGFLAVPVLYGIRLSVAVPAALLPLVLYAAVLVFALYLLRRRARGDVPRAVVTLIAGMSLLDAVVLAGDGRMVPAVLAIAGFALTLALQRWISGT